MSEVISFSFHGWGSSGTDRRYESYINDSRIEISHFDNILINESKPSVCNYLNPFGLHVCTLCETNILEREGPKKELNPPKPVIDLYYNRWLHFCANINRFRG